MKLTEEEFKNMTEKYKNFNLPNDYTLEIFWGSSNFSISNITWPWSGENGNDNILLAEIDNNHPVMNNSLINITDNYGYGEIYYILRNSEKVRYLIKTNDSRPIHNFNQIGFIKTIKDKPNDFLVLTRNIIPSRYKSNDYYIDSQFLRHIHFSNKKEAEVLNEIEGFKNYIQVKDTFIIDKEKVYNPLASDKEKTYENVDILVKNDGNVDLYCEEKVYSDDLSDTILYSYSSDSTSFVPKEFYSTLQNRIIKLYNDSSNDDEYRFEITKENEVVKYLEELNYRNKMSINIKKLDYSKKLIKTK